MSDKQEELFVLGMILMLLAAGVIKIIQDIC